MERFDSALNNLVSGEKAESGDTIIDTEGNLHKIAPNSEIQGQKDPNADLKAQEAAGQEFLKKTVAELALCHTKAQLTVFKNKHIQDRMKLLPDSREYFDAMFAEAFNKVK